MDRSYHHGSHGSRNDRSNNTSRQQSMMTGAIPRRSLPPVGGGGGVGSGSRGGGDGNLDTMTIPRRSTSSNLDTMTIPRRSSSSHHHHKNGPSSPRASSSNKGRSLSFRSRQHHHNNNNSNNNSHRSIYPSSSKISVPSEYPFIVRIRTHGIPMNRGQGITTTSSTRTHPHSHHTRHHGGDTSPNDSSHNNSNSSRPPRTSSRTPKRKRRLSYQDLQDTDSDAGLVDSDDQEDQSYPQQKHHPQRPHKRRTSSSSNIVTKKLRKTLGKSGSSNSLNRATAATAASGGPPETKRSSERRSAATGLGLRSSNKQSSPAAQSSSKTYEEQFTSDEDDLIVPQSNADSSGGLSSPKTASTLPLDPNAIDSPPPGVLNTLWYSRECFLHVFVVDKIVGWKQRPTTGLELNKNYYENNRNIAADGECEFDEFAFLITKQVIPTKEANEYSQKCLLDGKFWSDQRKRMEISRINPTQCPVVFAMAAAKEAASCVLDDTNNAVMDSSSAENEKSKKKEPRFTLKWDPKVCEEVLLVKWRGRSHYHCSWERPSDITRLDPSNNTARNKIRRYYQSQEGIYGRDWKQILEEERATAAAIHSHGGLGAGAAAAAAAGDVGAADNNSKTNPSNKTMIEQAEVQATDEEFFPPQCLEIERILACDENEMDLNVLAKQRALNIREEQNILQRIEKEDHPEESKKNNRGNNNTSNRKTPIEAMIDGVLNSNKDDEPWDPEDNVRYVVKWKGLPYAEMTWEYWRDIKRDGVNEAEDFWYRQKPPDSDEVKRLINKSHPHIRDFRKLQKSNIYGMSKRNRPVAVLDKNKQVKHNNDMDSDSNKKKNPLDSGTTEETESSPGFQLRMYQLEGVNWLLFNWWNKRSCILADEMGLGKTIQSMCFLQELHNIPSSSVRGPFLIVAPLSLIGQWQSEAKMWAPDFNVVLYHGNADARDFLVKQEFYYTNQFVAKPQAVKLRKQHITKFHILITTYEVALKDINVISKIRWKALIVDEAHRLKNSKSRLFLELATVPRDYCVLLTGTPLANATEELWALLHFNDPVAFNDKESFLTKFGQLTDSKQVNELHNVLKPYLLRRVKEDVEKSLPPKEETILEVSLTPIQKTYYKAIYERNTNFLYKGAKPSNAPSLMNIMMELRKCCNHPYLVKGAEERILADAATNFRKKQEEEKPTNDDKNNQHGGDTENQEEPIDFFKLFGEQLVKSSGKMVLIEKLLLKLFTGGHKVLIFSQMVRVLDLLEEFLKIKRYKYERLDGSTSSSSRAAAVDRFSRKSCQRFVMLLSTRAGGLGLNLTAADIVIIFDSDWNPQNDLQAMARAHRIGQTRAVRVYRLLTAKTYEMHMFHSASLKLGLERAVLSQQRGENNDGAGEGDDGNNSSNKKSKSDREAQAKEIDELLKKGAYDVFRDDDDGEAEKFMESDIDQLLERSSKKVTYGASSTSSLGGSGLGSFSKASFVASTGDGEEKDVDLDDPDFWKKAVGLDVPVETPEDVAAMLDAGAKRSRKQVQVFDPYAEFAEAEQRKKDKIALKLKEEKEEKERLRQEKKLKKKEEKDRKKRERDEKSSNNSAGNSNDKLSADGSGVGTGSGAASADDENEKQGKSGGEGGGTKGEKKGGGDHNKSSLNTNTTSKKVVKENKSKKPKKTDRIRALRRAENEDPVVERLKQAWEVPQRNRAMAAVLRFGFGRFCKIRNESNLTSLPLQDMEVFFRSYVYQLSLQLAVAILKMLRSRSRATVDNASDDGDDDDDEDIRPLLREWLGPRCATETDWVCSSIYSAMKLQCEIESRRRFLRMPFVLAEPSFVSDLRRGAAFRSLRRIGFLGRLNNIIEDAIDSILSELGHEELAKRGCGTCDLSTLDADLRARHVSCEELSLAIAFHQRLVLDLRAPATWWDRSCDVALLIGTFVHGLGNYEAMRNDEDMPFANKIENWASSDEACCAADRCFQAAVAACLKVFADALESAKAKAAEEVQAAVAAAAAAASEREQDALALRKGGAAADAIASKVPSAGSTVAKVKKEVNNDDSHYVTLPRLQKAVIEAVRRESLNSFRSNASPYSFAKSEKNSLVNETKVDIASGGKSPSHYRLPMPDSRVLDRRLVELVYNIEKSMNPHLQCSMDSEMIEAGPKWETSNDAQINCQVRSQAVAYAFAPAEGVEDFLCEYSGVGISGAQCASNHRSLDDGSDFSMGAASTSLAHIAYGTDAPRYLRAIGVPMNLTRFAIVGLVHADEGVLQQMLEVERVRNHNGMAGAVNKSTKPSDDSDSTKPLKQEKPEATGLLLQHVPDVFLQDAKLRASICVTVLFYGLPSTVATQKTVDRSLWTMLREQSGLFDDVPPDLLFDMEKFRNLVSYFAPDIDLPDSETIQQYVENVLLPHCLALCVMGNGPSTRNARGSKGAYETAFGISHYPEPSMKCPSPLPDPCMPLNEQSLEAVAYASAILRRVRLMRTALYIASGNISMDVLDRVTRSSFMRKNLDGLPLWWCPWIHDVALLMHAATRGLFHILPDRRESSEGFSGGSVFSHNSIVQNMYSTFVADEETALPRFIVDQSSPDEETEWIELHAKDFPTENVLERRLAFLCAQATADITEGEIRYDSIPMFDHGGWPRN